MANIAIIGDRGSGKTSVLRALAEHSQKIQFEGGRNFAHTLYDPSTKNIAPTAVVQSHTKQVVVALPNQRDAHLAFQWIDTPGEIWEDLAEFQSSSPAAFNGLMDQLSGCDAIILLLPPHTGLVSDATLNLLPTHLRPTERIKKPDQWVKNIQFWLDFFGNERLRTIKHLILSIHKADLFCQDSTFKEMVNLHIGKLHLELRKKNQGYFNVAQRSLERFNGTDMGGKTEYFVTTTENIGVLELPFLHLAAYLDYYDRLQPY